MAEIIAQFDENALEKAFFVLKKGGLVALPTETVYGLAGDATSENAVARIFQVKNRPPINPLIIHVSSLEMAQDFAYFDPVSLSLAEKLWPGPLALVLDKKQDCTIHPFAGAGLPTLALRMPRGFACKLIECLGRPLAAPSANRSGRISPTTAQAVNEELGDHIDLIVDGGKTDLGLESTIIKVKNESLQLLRAGMTPVDILEKISSCSVQRIASSALVAPGMMRYHYAPKTKMRLNATEVKSKEGLLGFGVLRAKHFEKAQAFLNLSPEADLCEAAANLFNYMRLLDGIGLDVIAVEPIPSYGYGEAINDRLTRAAAL